MSTARPILEVENLKRYFDQSTSIVDTLLRRDREQIQAVDDVSFTLHENESIGIIGESGCGKSTLLETLIGLQAPTAGRIRYKGKDMAEFDKSELKSYRGDVQIIFQDPFNTLNPKMTIKESLEEQLGIHDMGNKEERIHNTLKEVELNPPDQYLDRVPDQLSGGELQRVAIARALIVEPKILLADEPASMLDVSTQASVLTLLSELREKRDLALIYISHDLSTVSHVCDIINVMYLGRIVERSETRDLLESPKHPYSQALIQAIPSHSLDHDRERTKIEGSPRDPIDMGEGCRFRDRCPERMDICEKTPHLVESEGHEAACHLYYDHEEYESETDEVGQEVVGEV
ncbi:ABC transporter ATP-binding protein [Halobellus salinisoli]|uniref:ABC transporter ATP-binding protein n=1 Tax=Halobellus salinisoli TaxID=3108500 RepID=UPI003008C9B3